LRDEVGVVVPVGGTLAALPNVAAEETGAGVAVFAESELAATVALPTAKVVLSGDDVSTPLISVSTIVVPSVTLISGTPASGSGDGEGVGEGVAEGVGEGVGAGVGEDTGTWAAAWLLKAIKQTARAKRHNKPWRRLFMVKRSILSSLHRHKTRPSLLGIGQACLCAVVLVPIWQSMYRMWGFDSGECYTPSCGGDIN
jgi:hypothetical protein